MPLPICRWISKFHRIEYGFFGFGLKKVTPCPRNVPSPDAEPVGFWMPCGNGFDSVTAGRRLAVLAAFRMFVVWLKPGWLMPCVPIEATNTPTPPRMTVPFPEGVHANPNRGLKYP